MGFTTPLFRTGPFVLIESKVHGRPARTSNWFAGHPARHRSGRYTSNFPIAKIGESDVSVIRVDRVLVISTSSKI